MSVKIRLTSAIAKLFGAGASAAAQNPSSTDGVAATKICPHCGRAPLPPAQLPVAATVNDRSSPNPYALKALAAFLDDQRLSQNNFADELGVSPGFFSDILTGRRRPSFETAKGIEELTLGNVTLAMWVRDVAPPVRGRGRPSTGRAARKSPTRAASPAPVKESAR